MDIPVDTPIPVGRPQGPTPLAPTYPATRRWIETWRVIAGNRKASVGLTIVGFFILLAIFGPIVLPQDPHTFTTDILQPPSAAHWFVLGSARAALTDALAAHPGLRTGGPCFW